MPLKKRNQTIDSNNGAFEKYADNLCIKQIYEKGMNPIILPPVMGK